MKPLPMSQWSLPRLQKKHKQTRGDMPILIETYWTVKQVADRLHVGEDCVRHWFTRGQLVRTKAGGKTLITETHLQDFLRRSTECDEAERERATA